VAISEYNAQLLQRRAPGSRVRVVHCGVDTCRFTPGTEPAGPITLGTILCVAGLQAKKGHRDLVESFARLAAERSSLHLMLVGEGPERAAIETAVKSLDLQDRVTLAGARSPNEIVDALHEAALFVLAAVCDDTGRMDGIPVALMEAMAAGVPVVTTSVSGIPELVSDGETGLVVEPGDPPALANAMAKLLDDDALRAHVRIAARAWVARDFDLYVEAAKLGELIDEAVAARA
jgi:glycosyltransferase involved in cell wall biosynthesis